MEVTDASPEVAFAEALALFQAELPVVRKDNTATVRSEKGNYSYSYADLTDITEVAMPVLAKHGLSFTSKPTMSEQGFVLRYALRHSAGHSDEGDYPLPDPAKTPVQQIGSYITYARRYSLCAVTGIAPGGDDDDGEKAQEARAADPLPRAARRPNATTRRGAPDDPAQVTDEWTTAEPARVTDGVWLEGFRRRVTAAGKPSELRGLQEEANVMWAEHKLSRDDAKAIKAEVDQRHQELTGELVSP